MTINILILLRLQIQAISYNTELQEVCRLPSSSSLPRDGRCKERNEHFVWWLEKVKERAFICYPKQNHYIEKQDYVKLFPVDRTQVLWAIEWSFWSNCPLCKNILQGSYSLLSQWWKVIFEIFFKEYSSVLLPAFICTVYFHILNGAISLRRHWSPLA